MVKLVESLFTIGVDDSTIQSEVNYMVQNYDEEGIFVHSFIDDATILRIVDEKLRSSRRWQQSQSLPYSIWPLHEDSQSSADNQQRSLLYCLHVQKYDLPVTLVKKMA